MCVSTTSNHTFYHASKLNGSRYFVAAAAVVTLAVVYYYYSLHYNGFVYRFSARITVYA